jgi:predicted transcriptional regulator
MVELRAHVAEGVAETEAGELVQEYSIEAVLSDVDKAEADMGRAPD